MAVGRNEGTAVSAEKNLWGWLDLRLGGHWFAQRVENEVGRDTPDVWFALYKLRAVSGWIELKVLTDLPKRPGTPLRLPKWTSGQRNWAVSAHRHGAWCFLGLQVLERQEFYLIPGHEAARLVEMQVPHEETLHKLRVRGLCVDQKTSRETQTLRLVDTLRQPW
jgi:hypothetical protein